MSNSKNRPPLYEGDKGWSHDRERRFNKIGESIDEDNQSEPKREHSKETLAALRALIEETEEAIRSNPETVPGRTVMDQSVLLQELLYKWFAATKDQP
jgi:hypothetical protein